VGQQRGRVVEEEIVRGTNRSSVLWGALAALALILGGCGQAGGSVGGAAAKPTIKLGSANFSESIVAAELYGQVLEANGYKIERHLNLGSREITAPALETGQIDVFPE
jgi:osmoprotectant transport system substrate-binding protein